MEKKTIGQYLQKRISTRFWTWSLYLLIVFQAIVNIKVILS